MRHWIATVVTYAIAGFLIAGATLFAWARSSQIAITDELTVVSRFEPTPTHEFEWHELGASSYRRNCGNCHGVRGEGGDQYPSLNHVADLTLAPHGRESLVDVLLYGLATDRRVPMPPMGHMADVELAAVINHVLTSFGNELVRDTVELYTPEDVRARRGQKLSPKDVHRGQADHHDH